MIHYGHLILIKCKRAAFYATTATTFDNLF